MLGHGVVHGELMKDGSTVVGDGDVAVRSYQHFVHSLGTERTTHEVGDGPSRQQIGLGRLEALDSGLGLLLLQDDEGAAVLVWEQETIAEQERERGKEG